MRLGGKVTIAGSSNGGQSHLAGSSSSSSSSPSPSPSSSSSSSSSRPDPVGGTRRAPPPGAGSRGEARAGLGARPAARPAAPRRPRGRRWRTGVRRHTGSPAQWFTGLLVQWFIGSTVRFIRWFIGSMVCWFNGSLAFVGGGLSINETSATQPCPQISQRRLQACMITRRPVRTSQQIRRKCPSKFAGRGFAADMCTTGYSQQFRRTCPSRFAGSGAGPVSRPPSAPSERLLRESHLDPPSLGPNGQTHAGG